MTGIPHWTARRNLFLQTASQFLRTREAEKASPFSVDIRRIGFMRAELSLPRMDTLRFPPVHLPEIHAAIHDTALKKEGFSGFKVCIMARENVFYIRISFKKS